MQNPLNTCTLVKYNWAFHSPPGNVGFNNPQHVDRGFVEFYKGAIKNLPQAKKLQNLANLWADTIGTGEESKTAWMINIPEMLGIRLKKNAQNTTAPFPYENTFHEFHKARLIN